MPCSGTHLEKEMCLGLGLTSENLCFEFEQNTKIDFHI